MIPVGLGDLEIVRSGGSTLVAYGLGSCIGVTAFDPVLGAGGMTHVVLPDSSLGRGDDKPGKYADLAVPRLIRGLIELGGKKSRLILKIAGGAQMLGMAGLSGKLDIGGRNAEAVRQAVEREGLALAAEETGGNFGRTMHLYLPAGRVTVVSVGRGEKDL